MSILILDKDKSFADALAQRFCFCEHPAIAIASGAQFFQVAGQTKPQVIILSQNLQNPSWSELQERFRSTAGAKEVRSVILLAREKSLGLEAQAKIHNISLIALKPLVFDDFLKVVKTALSS